ncbi:MAG TPA: flavodoxin domain-containing protein [Gemmatimonadales bacterium]|nr:flavodoxin domain-containing protein [Gemmatimonadales bacterium]
MSNLLILYGTTDGHTAKIAATLATTLREGGATVTVRNATQPDQVPPLRSFDGVVVAASIHVGSYQRAVTRWVRTHAQELNGIPSAFLSVCLGILEQRPAAQETVRATATRFLRRVGWEPRETKTIAGALPYTRYNWFKKRIMKRIAARAGNHTDTTRDYEYTNWEDLRAFAAAFADQAARRASGRALSGRLP